MKSEVIEKMATLMITALGLVAALAWNGAIIAIFKEIFGDPDTVPAMLIYAVIVTIVAVFAIIWIGRIAEKTKTEK